MGAVTEDLVDEAGVVTEVLGEEVEEPVTLSSEESATVVAAADSLTKAGEEEEEVVVVVEGVIVALVAEVIAPVEDVEIAQVVEGFVMPFRRESATEEARADSSTNK